MGAATPPSAFLIKAPFKHHRPEHIQEMARAFGFVQETEERKPVGKPRKSEIWVKATEAGFWVIRIDSQGHDILRHFGARPHYHKEWINADLLEKYLSGPCPEAVQYGDDGALIARGKTHPDSVAKQAHIPR